ncbi:MAG: stongly similar to sigma 54 response regulator [Candidatus Brocadiaceae bacterium]|nr:stongly similar to sigma 54 response regulator [Candidatus Brocadiaceae bacterium]
MASVLIIEEQEKIQKSMVGAFKRENYKTCDGTDLEKAVEFLNKNVYDLVIVDLEVKSPAGFEMLKIIIAIFNPNEYDKGRIISYGVYDYVLKPFLLRDVVGIGKKALEKKQLSDKVRNLEQIRDMDKFALS